MNRIPVFYRPAMNVPGNNSYSPSAGKPWRAVTDWIAHGLAITPMPDFDPVDRDTIKLAHDPHYVDGVLDCTIANGFGNCDEAVADSLPYTVGSMLAAAKYVVDHKIEGGGATVACSPTSGFHHARYSNGFGFCTFNGLVITAMALKQAGLVRRVGILDCDYHYGDGTDDIINQLGLDWITHWSAGKHGVQAKAHMANVSVLLKNRFVGCDVLLYQAGADQHVADPLGGLLTTEQMRERDRQVFHAAAHYGIPLAWNLAGGYQRDDSGGIEPVLALHRQTMQVCSDIYIGGK